MSPGAAQPYWHSRRTTEANIFHVFPTPISQPATFFGSIIKTVIFWMCPMFPRRFFTICATWLLCNLCFVPSLQAGAPSTLDADGRIKIIRTLGSEYVALKVPLPINKNGLVINSKGEFDWKKNEESSITAGQFIAPGITVQVTNVMFAGSKMMFEVNGGGKKKKKRFLERIQIGGGGGMTPVANPTAQAPPQGSYVSIQFDKHIPNITPEEVKDLLSNVLDFSKKSATKSFIESIPDEFQEAVKNKQAVVGMDKDLVLATLGRPIRKVRERKGEEETEDWIYGERPHKIIFVTFLHGKVISVKEY
jgi:hypothetical protein